MGNGQREKGGRQTRGRRRSEVRGWEREDICGGGRRWSRVGQSFPSLSPSRTHDWVPQTWKWRIRPGCRRAAPGSAVPSAIPPPPPLPPFATSVAVGLCRAFPPGGNRRESRAGTGCRSPPTTPLDKIQSRVRDFGVKSKLRNLMGFENSTPRFDVAAVAVAVVFGPSCGGGSVLENSRQLVGVEGYGIRYSGAGGEDPNLHRHASSFLSFHPESQPFVFGLVDGGRRHPSRPDLLDSNREFRFWTRSVDNLFRFCDREKSSRKIGRFVRWRQGWRLSPPLDF